MVFNIRSGFPQSGFCLKQIFPVTGEIQGQEMNVNIRDGNKVLVNILSIV